MTFNLGAFNFADWGASGYGHKDVDEAKRQGASQYQLWQLGDRADKEGVSFIDEVREYIGDRPDSPWDYAGFGGSGFGKKDLDELLARGEGLSTVEANRKWAREHGLNIGWEVDDYISSTRQDMRDEQQQQWQADQTAAAQASAAARDTKQQNWQTQMLQEQQAHQSFLAAEQQKMNERMSRVRSSSPTGVGGNADFRGSRLTTTTGGGGRGPARFSRVAQPLFTNQMNTTGASGATSKSNVNL